MGYFSPGSVVFLSPEFDLEGQAENHFVDVYLPFSYNCERFEPRRHFRSRLSLIVQVNIVLNRAVAVDSD